MNAPRTVTVTYYFDPVPGFEDEATFTAPNGKPVSREQSRFRLTTEFCRQCGAQTVWEMVASELQLVCASCEARTVPDGSLWRGPQEQPFWWSAIAAQLRGEAVSWEGFKPRHVAPRRGPLTLA